MSQKENSEEKEKLKINKFWIIIVVSIILLSSLFFYLGYRIKFLVQDELQIYIEPLHSNLTVRNNDVISLDFFVANKNFRTCKTTCNLSLTNLYTQEVIDKKSIVLENNQEITQEYNFIPKLEGEGQRIFLFEATCNNIRTSLCNTNEEQRYRSAMVTLDHTYSEEEESLLLYLEDMIPEKYKNLVLAKDQEKKLQTYFTQINNTIHTNLTINEKADSYLVELNDVISAYYSQNFLKAKTLLDEIPEVNHNPALTEFNNRYENYNHNVDILNKLNEDRFDKAYDYFVKTNDKRAARLKSVFDDIRGYRLNTFEDVADFDNLSNFYNTTKNIITNYSSEKNKTDTEYYKKVIHEYNQINKTSVNMSGDMCQDAVLIYDLINNTHTVSANNTNISFNISYCTDEYELMPLQEYDKIELEYESDYSGTFKLSNPPKKCCVFNKCNECLVNSSNYPIIFVHGYSFNNNDPPESSINSFTKIQKKLNDEGHYINAGDIDYSSNFDAYWSEMNVPVSVRATYYYIPYYETGTIVKSIRKEEGIESYSIRLKELIDYTLRKTGADKVKIIAHSMGGLVTRNYLDLFGEDKVDKIILIGTPNHGITGRVETFCAYLGDKKACENMAQNSIFMKRLSAYKPTVPIYTIIGKGCDTDGGEEGDGIVTAESSYLEYAQNIYVNGSCPDFLNTDLHRELTDPNEYPAVYDHIKDIMID